jgi:hypothetical protein
MTLFGRFRAMADPGDARSLSNRFRTKRFARFEATVADLPWPIRVLDVGGEVDYWIQRGVRDDSKYRITIVNVSENGAASPFVDYRLGDATRLPFDDQSFDVVHSNSCVEHVGDLADEMQAASEIRRVAPRYFVQTPCRATPFEPHFQFPFFGLLPFGARVWLVRRLGLGHGDRKDAEANVREVRLLNKREVRRAFPDATIWTERVLGLPKSFVVTGGVGTGERPDSGVRGRSV